MIKKVLTVPEAGYVRIRAVRGDTAMITAVDTTAMVSKVAMLEIKIDRLDNEREIAFDRKIPAHELYQIIKCAKSDLTVVDMYQDTFDTTIVCETGTFKFVALDGRDFPIAPSNDGLSIATYYDKSDLAACLDFVLPASCDDETRDHINVVCFEGDKLLATDGHRLHGATAKVALNGRRHLSRAHALVLRALCDCALTRHDVAVQVQDSTCTHDGMFFFTSCDVVFIASDLCVQFPPWEQVVPAIDDVYTMPTKSFMAVLKKAPVGNDKSAGLRLVVNGTVKVEVSTNDRQSSVEVKPIVCAKNDVTIGFCARYLREAIDTSDDTLTCQFGSHPLDPTVIRHGRGNFAVVMPTRI
jgi:DNA polymerase III sliding clamp (beta) subunit (PCNA family)